MRDLSLSLDQHVLQAIIEHCLDEKPYEACGILTGRLGKVHRAYATTNACRSPVYYEVDSAQQAFVFAQMKENGDDLVAIYHSHPTASSQPSGNDIKMAKYYPEAIRLIVSLAGPTSVGAYLIEGGQVAEVTLQVGEGFGGQFIDLRQ